MLDRHEVASSNRSSRGRSPSNLVHPTLIPNNYNIIDDVIGIFNKEIDFSQIVAKTLLYLY